jgi:Rrf2 family transcriptional regulator, nitric oxide-sensitive transcriptional repressor
MFSQTVEYALRAMVYLADQTGPRTTPQIAEVTQVPAPYLAKVMQSLNRAGLVKSQRGVHGGFRLARPSEELTIWDIVQGVEPIRRIRSCPLSLEAHRNVLCPLHKRLDDALAGVEKAFRASTLAELLAEPTTSKPLCPFPQSIAPPALRKK